MTSADENSFDISTLARLSYINLSKQEQKTLKVNLSKIVHYMESLQEVDTKDIPACTSVLDNHMGSDLEERAGILLEREVFLANSPSQVGGMIRVPPIITY